MNMYNNSAQSDKVWLASHHFHNLKGFICQNNLNVETKYFLFDGWVNQIWGPDEAKRMLDSGSWPKIKALKEASTLTDEEYKLLQKTGTIWKDDKNTGKKCSNKAGKPYLFEDKEFWYLNKDKYQHKYYIEDRDIMSAIEEYFYISDMDSTLQSQREYLFKWWRGDRKDNFTDVLNKIAQEGTLQAILYYFNAINQKAGLEFGPLNNAYDTLVRDTIGIKVGFNDGIIRYFNILELLRVLRNMCLHPGFMELTGKYRSDQQNTLMEFICFSYIGLICLLRKLCDYPSYASKYPEPFSIPEQPLSIVIENASAGIKKVSFKSSANEKDCLIEIKGKNTRIELTELEGKKIKVAKYEPFFLDIWVGEDEEHKQFSRQLDNGVWGDCKWKITWPNLEHLIQQDSKEESSGFEQDLPDVHLEEYGDKQNDEATSPDLQNVSSPEKPEAHYINEAELSLHEYKEMTVDGANVIIRERWSYYTYGARELVLSRLSDIINPRRIILPDIFVVNGYGEKLVGIDDSFFRQFHSMGGGVVIVPKGVEYTSNLPEDVEIILYEDWERKDFDQVFEYRDKRGMVFNCRCNNGGFEKKDPYGECSIVSIVEIKEGDNIVVPEFACGLLVTKIEKNAFKGLPANQIILPNSIDTIEEGAFSETDIYKIRIPEKVKFISDGLFYNCRNLQIVEIDGNISGIGRNAFKNCINLKSCKRPDRIAFMNDEESDDDYPVRICLEGKDFLIGRTLGDGAFMGCESIERVYIDAECIGKLAFYGCKKLKEISSFYSVQSESFFIKEIGAAAFGKCKSLEKIFGIIRHSFIDEYERNPHHRKLEDVFGVFEYNSMSMDIMTFLNKLFKRGLG